MVGVLHTWIFCHSSKLIIFWSWAVYLSRCSSSEIIYSYMKPYHVNIYFGANLHQVFGPYWSCSVLQCASFVIRILVLFSEIIQSIFVHIYTKYNTCIGKRDLVCRLIFWSDYNECGAISISPMGLPAEKLQTSFT